MLKTDIKLILILVTLFIAGCKKEAGIHIQTITNWQFRKSGDTAWLPATVPGCVHTDLLANKVIEDPYFGDNEKRLQWIEKENWQYKSVFRVEGSLLHHDRIELVFDGLDTYADVWLNDSLVVKAYNMFRKWEVACREILKTGENVLSVTFYSPVYMDSVKASAPSYKLPDIRGFTRKAPYQYGWDWGPRFVTSGIWKPVYIRALNNARISDVQVVQNKLRTDTAFLTANLEIQSVKDQNCMINIDEIEKDRVIAETEVHLLKGNNTIAVTFQIPEPKLWWPNGMGDQNRYALNFIIQAGGASDTISQHIGLRTIELVQKKDSVGESFYFTVNGIPVFMKGANYIPQDNFPSRVTDEKYRQTIQSAVDANMNMLRVWGGGIYEKDIFYDLCDETGILVWQDFMFACNMYPGDPAFLENVSREAEYQVKRLRSHPCLALWCGNNEVDEGWHNWGWQQALNYSASDSTEIWNNYLKIFKDILPRTVEAWSPLIPYISSSPRIGWGHKEAMTEGDMHYWGVWWGEEPFEAYENKIGRFMSEYGFQGFPDTRTLESCLNPEDMNLGSEALLNHQKHPRGMELINTYMAREYKVPKSFEEYGYVSQLVQAYGIRKAIEAHRRAMPRCMGTLYWQLNDCWPVISWSSVDYYNRWKALHYFVKEAYQEVIVAFEKKETRVEVFIVSDRTEDFSGKLNLQIADFDGNIRWKSEREVMVQKNGSAVYANIDINKITADQQLLTAVLRERDSVVAANIYYLLPPKDLALPRVRIIKEINLADYGYQIMLTADKLAKNVFLSSEIDGFFSENYFDLLPGEPKDIRFYTERGHPDFPEKLIIKTLTDTYK